VVPLMVSMYSRVIQRLAGWTSLRMLERYGHARDAAALRAVTLLSKKTGTVDPAEKG
jgi:hypothetical protein